MKERPILFTTGNIRAILDGGKSQTRRIINTVNKILIIHIQHNGCFVIFTTINEISYGKIDFKTNSDLAKQRLYGWERWTDLLKDEVQRIWQEGVRGLVSIKGAHNKKGIFDCILESRESESNEGSSQTDLYGISWDASRYINAGKAFGRKSEQQQSEKSKMGDSDRELAGSKRARSWNGRREASHEQINGLGEIPYSLGLRNRVGFAKANCKDIGNVTIRYKQNLRWAKGMTLWVRETFLETVSTDDGIHYEYKADYSETMTNDVCWKPSIFMPKEACRIRLRVEDIRVERLHDISDEDCKAEGLTAPMITDHPKGGWYVAYKSLWESINGKGSWNKNPWVWVIKFKRI